MDTTADIKADGKESEEHALTPERRLDAIADIFARGLARIVLAEASRRPDSASEPSQVSEMSPETTLIDGQRRAVMVAGAGRPGRRERRTHQMTIAKENMLKKPISFGSSQSTICASATSPSSARRPPAAARPTC